MAFFKQRSNHQIEIKLKVPWHSSVLLWGLLSLIVGAIAWAYVGMSWMASGDLAVVPLAIAIIVTGIFIVCVFQRFNNIQRYDTRVRLSPASRYRDAAYQVFTQNRVVEEGDLSAEQLQLLNPKGEPIKEELLQPIYCLALAVRQPIKRISFTHAGRHYIALYFIKTRYLEEELKAVEAFFEVMNLNIKNFLSVDEALVIAQEQSQASESA